MLKVLKLYKQYKSIKTSDYVLDNVSFNIGNSGLVFIIGESGAGKTTLLNILGTLDTGDSGHVYFNNEDVCNYSSKKKERYRSNQIGFIFQEHNLFVHLSVQDNILISEASVGKKTNKYEDVLELLDLVGLQNRYPHELSTGQKQRVAIARALIKEPKIILADEPTGSLDYENATIVMKYLKDISKKCLVIVVSHNLELANLYADRIIQIDQGKLIKDEFRSKDLLFNSNSDSKQKLSLNKKLPFNVILKYIISNIKTKKVSTAVLTLLISFLVTTLSLLTFIVNYDNSSFTLENMKLNKDKNISINYLDKRYDEELNEYRKVMPGMKDENVNYLTTKFPKYKFVPALKSNLFINLIKDNNNYVNHKVNGIIEIDNTTLNNLNFTLLAGKIPEKNSDYIEIAISDYIYQIIYKNKCITDGEIISVKSYNSILNKIITEDNQKYKIVGIIDTNYNYNQRIHVDMKDALLKNEPHNAVFTYNGYYKDIILQGETDTFKVLNGKWGYFKLSSGSNFDTSIEIEYIQKLNNQVDVIFMEGYNIDKFGKDDVVISFEKYERLFFHDSNPLASVDDLILNFAEENFPLIKDDFEKDFENSNFYNYYNYILYNNGENKYQPGFDYAFFRKTVIKDIISNGKHEVELTDFKDSLYFSKKLNIVGVIDYETDDKNLYVSNRLYNELFEYNDGEIAYVTTSINNSASDLKLMDFLYTNEENYKFSNGIRATIDIVRHYFELLSSFYLYFGFILICFTMAILYYLSHTMLKNEKKNIGLLVALGIKKIDIIKILSYELIFISILSIPVCLFTSSLFTILFNFYIKNMYFVKANAIMYNPLVIVIIYLITIFIFVSINFKSIYKYSRISPISVIKNNA